MKQHLLRTVLALSLLSTQQLPAQIISHQLFDSNAGALTDNLTGVVGTLFRTTDATNRLVTHLGYYDSDGQGLQTSHRVGLYAATATGAGTGALLAEVTLPAGTNTLFENGFRWAPLSTPIILETNTDYVVATEVTAGSGDPYPAPTVRVWNRYYVGYAAATTRAARMSTNSWPHEPETQTGNNSGYGAANLGLALTPRPYRIMPLGDSITAGYTDNPVWNVPFQFGYRSELFKLLSSNGIPFQFVGNSLEPWNGLFGLPKNKPDPDLRPLAQDQHEGYGGQGTAYVSQNIRTWLTNDRPDIILMMIGINDIGAGQTGAPTTVQRALSNIVQTIVTVRPATHVIVAQIMPYSVYTPALQEYNDYIKTVLVPSFAARGYRVTTVDQSANFVTDPAGLHPDPNLYSNGINHPNAVAYARMAQTWLRGIQSVLSGGPTPTITNPPATREASPGAMIPIDATTTAGSGGDAVRLQLLVNGVPQAETLGTSISTNWQVPTPGAHLLTVRATDAQGNFGEDSVHVLGVAPGSGPGGVTNGLQVWLKAEAGIVYGAGSSVQRWEDQSGNLNHAAQSSPATQPRFIEGLFGSGPGLRFDTSRFLTATNGMSTNSYTKVVRFFIGNTNTPNNLLSSPLTGSAAARGHALLFGMGQQTLKMAHNSNFVQSAVSSVIGESTVTIATYDVGTDTGELYLDGVLRGSGTAPGDNTMVGYQIGALGGSSRLIGAISEVMIYDRVLSATERQAVLRYFDDKSRAPFGLWQNRYFTPGDPKAVPGADASGDGLANAVKYALGLNPLTDNTGSDHLPQIKFVGDTAEVAYRRSTEASDVICALESSHDLERWTPVADSFGGIEGTTERRLFSWAITASNALFLRIRVTVTN